MYNGTVQVNESGEAVVKMPNWFDALNAEFTYQLTCVGGYANVYVKEEMKGNEFVIAGGKPGMKISWQVTGVRKDKWAEANRVKVEVDKEEFEKGYYQNPEAFGYGEEKSVGYARQKFNLEKSTTSKSSSATNSEGLINTLRKK